jgi:hypothetical protein
MASTRSASIRRDNTDAVQNLGETGRRAMSDYWLNKLFFDLQQPTLSAEYNKDRESVLARYPLKPELRRAVLADDLAAIAPHVNAYLLRFYFAIRGMKDAEFIQRVNEISPKKVSSHG